MASVKSPPHIPKSHTGKNALESQITFEIKLGSYKYGTKEEAEVLSTPVNYVTPGTVLTTEPGFMRGHGTFSKEENKTLVASVVGCVERVNRLVTVKNIGSVYYGEVGDVVVGRVTKTTQKRWKVDINGRLEGILLLSSINLPSGELRRRSAEDELAMRQILKEGDIISAEIQSAHRDGSLALHTRSVKYGKLGPGTLVKVPCSLIKRRKNHIHNLPCGACVILGNNGYIWISPLTNGRMPGTNMSEEDPENLQPTLHDINIAAPDLEMISRLRNSILSLSKQWIPIFDTSLVYAYEATMKFHTRELSKPEIMTEVAELVREQMKIEEAL